MIFQPSNVMIATLYCHYWLSLALDLIVRVRYM